MTKADDAGLVGRTIRTLRNPGPIARQFSPFLNETADLIEAQAADIERWQARAIDFADRLELMEVRALATEAKLASVRAALEPFAKLGAMLDGPFAPAIFKDEDSAGIGGAWSENGEPRFVTFGDLRRAAAIRNQERADG